MNGSFRRYTALFFGSIDGRQYERIQQGNRQYIRLPVATLLVAGSPGHDDWTGSIIGEGESPPFLICRTNDSLKIVNRHDIILIWIKPRTGGFVPLGFAMLGSGQLWSASKNGTILGHTLCFCAI